MEGSDETNQLIDRLLKSNINPSNLNPNDPQGNDPLNLTEEQLQLLANVYKNFIESFFIKIINSVFLINQSTTLTRLVNKQPIQRIKILNLLFQSQVFASIIT